MLIIKIIKRIDQQLIGLNSKDKTKVEAAKIIKFGASHQFKHFNSE